MGKTFFFGFLLCLTQGVYAQDQLSLVTSLPLEPGKEEIIRGDLAEGQPMNDLSWAWNSSVACFPETQAYKFNGNHVLYALELPSYSELEIQLEPVEKDTDLSIYAYLVGQLAENNIVPNLSSCQRCEVDHRRDMNWAHRDANDPKRVVHDILTANRSKFVIIGVAGANKQQSGAYALTLKINPR